MVEIKQLFREYADTLRRKNAELGGYYWGNPEYPAEEQKTPEQVAEKMFNAIFKASYRADWLKHNEALREACRAHGITKSADLRTFIKQNWSVQETGKPSAEAAAL